MKSYLDSLYDKFLVEYPEHFLCVPKSIALKMLSSGVVRSRSHGFTLDNTVEGYIRLMILLGADFDRSPLVAGKLDGDGEEGARLAGFTERLGEKEWEVVRSHTSDRAWFAPDDGVGWATYQLFNAFPDYLASIPDNKIHIILSMSSDLCRSINLASERALCVVAACLIVYGQGLTSSRSPAWFADIMPQRGYPESVRLELLRLRIALDSGRSI